MARALCNNKLMASSTKEAEAIMIRAVTRNVILRTMFDHKYLISCSTILGSVKYLRLLLNDQAYI